MEETQDTKKKILKEIVKRVLSLGETGINKMREMKMLNLKLIERSSKCTKDPNPLATTMWMMNSKYPLAINKDLARKYKIPSEYICPGKQGEDAHRHKLVLAKKDCIEWWINSSPLPSNDEREIIDILLTEGRKQVQTYYSVKWKGSRIKWGQPVLERKMVRTRNPVIEVPPSLREELIKEIMFPDLTIPSSRVTQSLIDKFKNLIHMKIETKMTLSRQMRILLNSMDPAERYIPMLPGLDNTLAPLKHSLCHNNFVLTKYDVETLETDSNLWKDEIENIGKCILREGLASKLTPNEATELMKKIRINKEPITKYIESRSLEKGIGSTTLKVLLGKPITLEREHEEVLICPAPAEGTRLDLYNQSNLGLTANTAIELNNFKFGEMRGTFTRSHTVIISISTNFTTLRDLKALLSRIGTYIYYGISQTLRGGLY
ncbi:unnamed protein product [Colias eurytheme]|nr:unnamed protein product [Colias eurytheme]